jgi:hypothetical protein
MSEIVGLLASPSVDFDPSGKLRSLDVAIGNQG